MKWLDLTDINQLEEINKLSESKAQYIFKHSTRCSISNMVKNRLERKADENTDCYYLDLLNHRDLSNHISELYSIKHESPQLLKIQNSKCTSFTNHGDISEAVFSN